jgi:enterochelin esterase-like enzyme
VGGLSRGGGWALHLALSDWEMYGSFGGHSMAIFWVDTTHIKTWLNEIPQEELPRIFLDIGDHDRPELLNSVTWFESLLTQRGIPHEFHLYTGYHEEKYWEEHVEEYLRWYAAGFP